MDVEQRPGIYHRTTIDAAKATYPNISCVGQKRTFDELRSGGKIESPVLADFTDRTEFRRPALQNDYYPPLKAGEIIDSAPKTFSEYSPRKALALTPGPSSNPLLDLTHPSYDLPEGLVRNFAALGIKSIYPWQAECLLRSGALGGQKNLVYTAPTGGGKSLVADILMLKKIIEHPEKKAILVLPYVALVQEKLRWLRSVVEGVSKQETAKYVRDSRWRKRGDEESVRIAGFFGGSKQRLTWADMDIAVCTIEKVCLLA